MQEFHNILVVVQVIIQEGPGWIIDQTAYTSHLKKFGMVDDTPRKKWKGGEGSCVH